VGVAEVHALAERELLAAVLNSSGYGLVESPTGAWSFLRSHHDLTDEQENVVVKPHPDATRSLGSNQGVPEARSVNLGGSTVQRKSEYVGLNAFRIASRRPSKLDAVLASEFITGATTSELQWSP